MCPREPLHQVFLWPKILTNTPQAQAKVFCPKKKECWKHVSVLWASFLNTAVVSSASAQPFHYRPMWGGTTPSHPPSPSPVDRRVPLFLLAPRPTSSSRSPRSTWRHDSVQVGRDVCQELGRLPDHIAAASLQSHPAAQISSLPRSLQNWADHVTQLFSYTILF